MSYALAAVLLTIYGIVIWLDSSSLTAGTAGTAEPSRRGATLAVHSMLGYAGGFVGPLMVGWVLDLSGGMSRLGWGLSFLSVAVLMALALITFWVIRPRELEGDKRKATEGTNVQKEPRHPSGAGPHGPRRQRARHHADHRVGYQLLLSGCAGQTHRRRHRLAPDHRVPRLQRGSARHGLHLDVGWTAHRSHRRPRRDVRRHDHRFGGLVGLSQVRDQTSYLAVWAVLGIGMRCCLYDAAFAALVQVTPTRGRKAISYLTLYGAYASTVFWVVGHYLNEAYGWRGTLIAFAAINLVDLSAAQLAWPCASRSA